MQILEKGGASMKAFLEEYGLIIVAVIVILAVALAASGIASEITTAISATISKFLQTSGAA